MISPVMHVLVLTPKAEAGNVALLGLVLYWRN
jgi:hypothetical protein